jgi:predicted CoA-binding protein
MASNTLNSPEVIKDIIANSKVIAVVGLSDRPERPSFDVALYLKGHGYRIIPVNPKKDEILKEKSYPDLQSVPESIDVVDVFRRSEFVEPIVDEAIAIGAKVVWLQEGVINENAAKKALDAGLQVVMDRCMKKEHQRLNSA